MKKKIELEFIINSSTKVLFSRLSTPSGLSEWFADDISIKGNNYIFKWDGSEQKAELISKKENKSIRFKWIDDEKDDSYFEFKIQIDELTNELALIITDFVDEDEEEDSTDLWNSQIESLKHAIGI